MDSDQIKDESFWRDQKELLDKHEAVKVAIDRYNPIMYHFLRYHTCDNIVSNNCEQQSTYSGMYGIHHPVGNIHNIQDIHAADIWLYTLQFLFEAVHCVSSKYYLTNDT